MSRSKRSTKKKPAGAATAKPAETSNTSEETAAVAASPAPAGESFSFATAHQMSSEPYVTVAAETPEADRLIVEAAEDESAAAAAYGMAEPAPAAETPVVHDHTHATGHAAAHDDHERGGFAATALGWLVGALVIAGLTLWLAPKVAPHMPAGVAEWLQPGAAAQEERIAALETRLQESQLSIEDRVAQLEAAGGAGDTGPLANEIERISGELESLAGQMGEDPEIRAELESAGSNLGALASRADTIEDSLGSIREELAAMTEALSVAGEGNGPSSDELSAAVAQVQTRIDNVSESVETLRTDLSDRIGEVDERLTAGLGEVRATLEDAAAGAAAAAEAQAAAEQAAKRAEAFAALSDALGSGKPYAEQLSAAEEVAGSSAPEALSAPAGDGVTQTAALSADLAPVARTAVAEEIRAESGDDAFSRVMTAVRSNVLSRPVDETEGDDIGAVLSRVDARLKEGNAAAAMSELEALPEETRASLGPWYDRLKERAAAERALAEWRQGAGSDS